MAKFEIDLSFEATERLWAVKEIQGKNDLTGNEFARELLEKQLYKLFPAMPQLDEQGRVINKEDYRGSTNNI